MAISVVEVPFPPGKEVEITVPIHSKILTVRADPGKPVLIIQIDPNEKLTELRKIKAVTCDTIVTGPPDTEYIGTFPVVDQKAGRMFFLHLFDLKSGKCVVLPT